ncbi:MAG: DUF4157 domain-containing protein [Cyanobacteriota bacterium]|nr:DUF4157 domain-containing protein [Cyanobacteriota bacterium]
MAGAASAHLAATATREDTSQQRAGRTRRTSADPQRAQQGATAVAAAALAALDSLSRIQHLADASPQVAQLRLLQALADSHYAPVSQLAGAPEEKELIQGQFASAELPPQRQPTPRGNNTGLPDQLKRGIESLSGLSMDHVRVHFNSSQPAQLNALAYAQGSDIHLAPGQEQHLPHEAWHVVQQAQGRVRPTLQLQDGVPVNDDVGLEREADVMGAKAASFAQELTAGPIKTPPGGSDPATINQAQSPSGIELPVQRIIGAGEKSGTKVKGPDNRDSSPSDALSWTIVAAYQPVRDEKEKINEDGSWRYILQNDHGKKIFVSGDDKDYDLVPEGWLEHYANTFISAAKGAANASLEAVKKTKAGKHAGYQGINDEGEEVMSAPRIILNMVIEFKEQVDALKANFEFILKLCEKRGSERAKRVLNFIKHLNEAADGLANFIPVLKLATSVSGVLVDRFNNIIAATDLVAAAALLSNPELMPFFLDDELTSAVKNAKKRVEVLVKLVKNAMTTYNTMKENHKQS